MKLTITGGSTALFSTWFFVEELGLLFDAGDGVSASLLQKSRKIKHAFITHADRDHVCGLLQLHQLNARDGSPAIYYPKDCGSFPAFSDFMSRFDPQSGPASWLGITENEQIDIGRGYSVRAMRSSHVVSNGATKALSYTVYHSRRQLKPECRNLSGREIAERKNKFGEDAVTSPVLNPILGYSGDCPALEPAHWNGVSVLIHEATFLENDISRGSHTNLAQAIASATNLELDALILMHFSSRYKHQAIEQAIKQLASKHKPGFPIFTVMPGVVSEDILSQKPIWAPSTT